MSSRDRRASRRLGGGGSSSSDDESQDRDASRRVGGGSGSDDSSSGSSGSSDDDDSGSSRRDDDDDDDYGRVGGGRVDNDPATGGGSSGSDDDDSSSVTVPDDAGGDDQTEDRDASERVGGGDSVTVPDDAGGDDETRDQQQSERTRPDNDTNDGGDPDDTSGNDLREDQRQSRRVGGTGDPTDNDPTGGDFEQDQTESRRTGGSGDPSAQPESRTADSATGSMAGGTATPAGGENSPFVEDQAAAEFDEETVSDTTPGDVVVEDDGTVRLTSDARLEEQRAQAAAGFEEELGRDVDPDNIILRGGGEAELEEDARPGAGADGAQGDRSVQASDPNAVAQVIGSAIGRVADSPVGEGIGSAADAVFEGENSPAEWIEQTLDPAAQYWERQITDEIAASDPPESNAGPTTIGDAADSALVRDSAEQASRFANLPALGRDLARAGQGANQAGEFLVENEAEAVQLVFDTAQRTPGVAAEAAQTAAENPRRTARSVAVTGGALAATAGVGGLARAGLRSGTRAASRRAARSASRVDDALGVRSGAGTTRRRLRNVRERAPDVTARRDPDAPRVEVDPLLQQQIRDAVQNPPSVSGAISRRASRPDFDTPSASGVREGIEERAKSVRDTASRASDVSERIGRRIQEARTRTALRAEVARESGVSGLVGAESAESVARRAGRGLERARIRGRLRARETSAAARERIGAPRPSGLPTRISSRVSGASERVADLTENIGGSIRNADATGLLPSTLASVSAPSVDAASAARSAGRQFERARIRGQIRARQGVATTRETADSATDIGDLDIGLSASSGDLGGSFRRRVDSATSFLSDGTIRIGPARPRRSRTTLDADDIELEPGAFPDDADLPGGSGGGNIDLEANVDAGRGSGSGQIGALSTRRRGRTDTFEESRVVRRNRRGGTRRDSFAFGGALATTGGVSALTGFDESEFGTPQSDLPVVSDLSLGLGGFTSTMTGTGDDITSSETGIGETVVPTTGTGFDFGSGTDITTNTSTSTQETTTTVTIDPGIPTGGDGPPKWDFPDLDGNEQESLDFDIDVDDEVFDTGVADPDKVLDRIL